MPRRKAADPYADLARKMEILEREMAAQRDALEKLKQMGAGARVLRSDAAGYQRNSAGGRT